MKVRDLLTLYIASKMLASIRFLAKHFMQAGLIYDFASTLSHELGHAHFLGHNVENDEIMFTIYNENVEGPESNDILGGKDVVNFSRGWLST
jgi:hypothetical protein